MQFLSCWEGLLDPPKIHPRIPGVRISLERIPKVFFNKRSRGYNLRRWNEARALAKIFMKVFMALSWRFKPPRSGCRGSRFRRFYRIMLINSRFDNVHPAVPSRPLIGDQSLLPPPSRPLRLNFHVKLPEETGNFRRRRSYVLASIIHLTFDCFHPGSAFLPLRSPSPFIPLEIRFITFRISTYIMTPLSSQPPFFVHRKINRVKPLS